jgi:hypothetical protein
MGDEKYAQDFGWRPEWKRHSEYLGADRKIILKWIFAK